MHKNIAILEGDGIGPEITREAVRVLQAVADLFGHTFELQYAPFGAAAYFSHNTPFPEETKRVCDAADAIVKGPVGLSVERMEEIPQEHRPEAGAILPLRARYDTFANYRPVYLPGSLAEFSPLRPEIIGEGIDILMIRELVGGIYFGDKVEGDSTNLEYAADNCVYKREEVARIAHVAFREAKIHGGLLTNIHKSNVLATSRFWRTIVEDIAPEYPDVTYRSMLVDNVAFQLVKNPRQFNGVMLLENMQGDIITDQAGGVIGSLGLMPSACVGPVKGYVEPSHGSAPDIAGRNAANPYSMIGSIALMLEKFFSLEKEATLIMDALHRVLEDGYRTPDLVGDATPADRVLGTDAFGDRTIEVLRELAG